MDQVTFSPTLLEQLRRAKDVVVLTGAGVSAESGIPTFREAQTGLWARFRAEELATPEAFAQNPELVWDWYAWRRQLVQDAQPNPAHYALARLAAFVPKLTLITQNVDNLHQDAGSKALLELHGNIMRTTCSAEGKLVTSWEATAERPPLCPDCGARLRPDVVWFGENLPPGLLERAVTASQTADLFFSIGTSSLVQPAASLPLYAAQREMPLIEINPSPTPLTPYTTINLRGAAGDILPRLFHAAWANFSLE